MTLPQELIGFMQRHRGLLTRAHAIAAGVPATTVDSWVARGQFEIVEGGVYRQPGSAVSDLQRLMAAVLRAGGDARVGGWSACALHRLEGLELAAVPWIVIPATRRVRGVEFVVQRCTLDRADIAKVAGLPTVTPMRGLIDAAMHISLKALRIGIDDARRRGLIDLDRLLGRAVALGRHRGAMTVLRMFGTGTLDQDGELERQLALGLAAVSLQPAWGMEVLPGVVVDACFPEASYALECDGLRWHTIDTDRAADVSRQGLLRADGWHVTRIRTEDLRTRRANVLAHIAATRRQRIEAGLGRPVGWRPVHAGRRIRPPRT